MLQNIKDLYGNRLDALDGDIGRVKDFYFDDRSWVARYLVADTGSWLAERLVLISPHAFAKLDHYEEVLHLKLSRKKIQESPAIESHMSVSRKYEEDYYRYYGWPVYWNGNAIWGAGDQPMAVPQPKAPPVRRAQPSTEERQLWSCIALTGYEIEGPDGILGQLAGYLVDDRNWAIHDLRVEAGPWHSGKDVLISPRTVKSVSYEDSRIVVSLTIADVQNTTENPVSRAATAQRRSGNFSN